MIDLCPQCHNHEWNKEVTPDKQQITCPNCGHSWNFKAMPLFILTGCSGVGKTTTAMELQQRDINFIPMDADFLYNLMPHETDEDYKNMAEQIMSLSKDIMQSGKPLLWTKAGALDCFEETYHLQFFTKIYYLALVCSDKELEKRMREGRKISDLNWITSSIDYNQWFMEHGIISGQKIDTYDITGKDVHEVANYVQHWIDEKVEA
ncbi:MAG: nucleoside kinase [Herbinix sp.]|jgi:broad-specificity NMP kinase|nr:nucleoside kinase [Herbinix sp.]